MSKVRRGALGGQVSERTHLCRCLRNVLLIKFNTIGMATDPVKANSSLEESADENDIVESIMYCMSDDSISHISFGIGNSST